MLEPNINLLPEDLQSDERFKPATETQSAQETTEDSKQSVSASQKKTRPPKEQRENVLRRAIAAVRKGLSPKKKEPSSIPEKSGVQLLTQEVLGPRSARPELIRLLGIVAGFVFLFAMVYVYYEWRVRKIQTATRAIQDENSQLDVSIARARRDLERTRETADIVATIDTILAHRTDWNAIFKRLESLTLRTVYYTKFASGGDGTIELMARAKTMDDALLQIQVFKQATDFTASVEADQFSVNEEKITVVGVETSEGVTTSFVEFPLSLTLTDDFYGKTTTHTN